MADEVLLIQSAMVESVFDLFEIVYKIFRTDPVVAQRPFFGIFPESFNSVAAGGAAGIFGQAVIHGLVADKILLQTLVGAPNIRIYRGFNGHFVSDNILQCRFAYVGNKFNVHNAILALADSKNRLL